MQLNGCPPIAITNCWKFTTTCPYISGAPGSPAGETPATTTLPIIIPPIEEPAGPGTTTLPGVIPSPIQPPQEEEKQQCTLAITKDLTLGQTDKEVKILKGMLKDLSYLPQDTDISNGLFDSDTKIAVTNFQKDYDIQQIGSVGPKTRAAINDTWQLYCQGKPYKQGPVVEVPQEIATTTEQQPPVNPSATTTLQKQPLVIPPATTEQRPPLTQPGQTGEGPVASEEGISYRNYH